MSVQETFVITSGIYTNEQQLLGSVDTFILGELEGWEKVDTRTDTSTDKDLVYYNDGDGTYDRNWIRLQATSNQLRFYMYSNYDPSTGIGSDQVFHSTFNQMPTGTGSGDYWLIGNRDAVYISISHSTRHMGGFGTWKTYYTPDWDPKPFYIFGDPYSTTFLADPRCRSYGAYSWGKGYVSTWSGTSRDHWASHTPEIRYSGFQARSGQPHLFASAHFHDGNFQLAEVRGEMPGNYLGPAATYSHGSLVTISGIGNISGTYFFHQSQPTYNVCYYIGKIIAEV